MTSEEIEDEVRRTFGRSRTVVWQVASPAVEVAAALPPPPASINEQVAALQPQPGRGYPRGGVFLLQRTGLVVTPVRDHGASWDCVVVAAPEGSQYPRGGYDISVGRDELARAVELTFAVTGGGEVDGG